MSGNKTRDKKLKKLADFFAPELRLVDDSSVVRDAILDHADKAAADQLCDRLLTVIGEQTLDGATLAMAVSGVLASVAVEAARTEFGPDARVADIPLQVSAAIMLIVATQRIAMNAATNFIEARGTQETVEQQEQLFREQLTEVDE